MTQPPSVTVGWGDALHWKKSVNLESGRGPDACGWGQAERCPFSSLCWVAASKSVGLNPGPGHSFPLGALLRVQCGATLVFIKGAEEKRTALVSEGIWCFCPTAGRKQCPFLEAGCGPGPLRHRQAGVQRFWAQQAVVAEEAHTGMGTGLHLLGPQDTLASQILWPLALDTGTWRYM